MGIADNYCYRYFNLFSLLYLITLIKTSLYRHRPNISLILRCSFQTAQQPIKRFWLIGIISSQQHIFQVLSSAFNKAIADLSNEILAV